jgi:hypothetical protein
MADGADLPATNVGGRGKYVRFSEALGEVICARVAAGESLKGVCAGEGMPHPTTVYAWSREQPGFGAALAEAQKANRVAARLADRARAAARLAAGRDGRGRWSTYTPEIGEEICARIAGGESLKAIGADPEMPCAATVLNWAARYPEFGDAYAQARAFMADVLFDEAREVALAATSGNVWVGRLQFDVIRWMTARMAPKKYCERVLVEAEVSARRAEDNPDRAPMTVIVKRFSDVTPEEEAAHDATEARAEARAWARGR